jgi:hypothetical protein
MKLALALVSCLVLSTGCKKKESDKAPPAPTPTAPARPAAAVPSVAAEAPVPTAGDGLALPKQIVKVGEKSTEVEDRTMAMIVETPGKKVNVESVFHSEELKEVVAVDGVIASKIKITYKAISDVETADGKRKDKPSLVAGKSYLVWREAGAVKVSLADGAKPSDAEIIAVTKDNRRVGRPDPFEEIVTGKTWKVGVKVDLTADELARINAEMATDTTEPSTTAISITLLSNDATTAIFAMTMGMKLTGPKGSMSFALAGTHRLDLTNGHSLELAMTGPIEGNLGVPVTGTMTAKTLYSY